MGEKDKPVVNPDLVFREEFDDWAILFDPDTGSGFGLNPVSAFIWKRLDGEHSLADIIEELKEHFDNVPESATQDLEEFVTQLEERGFIGYEMEDGGGSE